ncbi:alginate lyase family protein [Paracoccaceae bacterium Fryx2]|nr:alginate lyase family protein [Paracoccaceae bacterium Fryx2]
MWFRLARPRPDLAPAPPLRLVSGPWCAPARRLPSLTGPGAFHFLNEAGSLPEHGWDGPAKAKLWRYNQHYFDDLNAMGAPERAGWHQPLIADWITANPPGRGTGWEPYPTSLRIVNWVKWALAGNAPSQEAIQSLAIQARWLTRRMEWHLLGNHLFANAKALVFAGLYFEWREAARWLDTGTRILAKEIPEQLLPDGGQFELSPMYHALSVEDMLDLVNIARAFGRNDLAQAWSARVASMLDWLGAMTHPDGDIAFFNDAAIGIAPDQQQLFDYAGRLGFARPKDPGALCHLAASGYARLSAGPAVLIADLARIGPDYLPGHAHADTLSFELSVRGQRIIVNSGTSVYGTGPERLRQRGTAAHSTLMIDGEDSSETWAGFRVGRRARPFDIDVRNDDAALLARAAHDGYSHMPGNPVHRREWHLAPDGLIVTDRVAGTGLHRVDVRFFLAPDLHVVRSAPNSFDLNADNGEDILTFTSEGGSVYIVPSSWHPQFGMQLQTQAIRVCAELELPCKFRTCFRWRAA